MTNSVVQRYAAAIDRCIDVHHVLDNLAFEEQLELRCGMHVVNNVGQLSNLVTPLEMNALEEEELGVVNYLGKYESKTVQSAFQKRGFTLVNILLELNMDDDRAVIEVFEHWKNPDCVGLYVESVLLDHYHGVTKMISKEHRDPLPILMDTHRGRPFVLSDFKTYLKVTFAKHTSMYMVLKEKVTP